MEGSATKEVRKSSDMSREQLLTYIKQQKVIIKKLEGQVSSLKSQQADASMCEGTSSAARPVNMSMSCDTSIIMDTSQIFHVSPKPEDAAKIEELTTQLNDRNAAFSALKTENEQYISTISSLQIQNRELKAAVDRLQQPKEEVESANAAEAEYTAKKAEVEELSQRMIDGLQRQVAALQGHEGEHDGKAGSSEDLTRVVEERNKEVRSLHDQVDHLLLQLSASTAKYGVHMTEKRVLLQQKTEAFDAMVQEKDLRYREQARKHEHALKQLEAQCEEKCSASQASAAQKHASVEQSEAALKQLEATVQEKVDLISAMQRKQAQLQEDADDHRVELNKFRRRVLELEESEEVLVAKAEDLEAEVALLKKNQTGSAAVGEALLLEEQRKYSEAMEMVDALSQDKALLERRLADSMADVSELRDAAAASEDKARNDCESALVALRGELEEKQAAAVAALESWHAASMDELRGQHDAAVRKLVEEQRCALEESKETAADAETAAVSAKAAEDAGKIQALQTQHKELEAKLAGALADKVAELEQLQQAKAREVSEAQAQLGELRGQLDKVHQEAQSQRDSAVEAAAANISNEQASLLAMKEALFKEKLAAALAELESSHKVKLAAALAEQEAATGDRLAAAVAEAEASSGRKLATALEEKEAAYQEKLAAALEKQVSASQEKLAAALEEKETAFQEKLTTALDELESEYNQQRTATDMGKLEALTKAKLEFEAQLEEKEVYLRNALQQLKRELDSKHETQTEAIRKQGVEALEDVEQELEAVKTQLKVVLGEKETLEEELMAKDAAADVLKQEFAAKFDQEMSAAQEKYDALLDTALEEAKEEWSTGLKNALKNKETEWEAKLNVAIEQARSTAAGEDNSKTIAVVAEKDTEISELRSKLANAMGEVEASVKKVEQVQELLDASEGKVKKLKLLLTKSRSSLQEKEAEIDRMGSHLSALEAEVSSERIKAETLAHEKEALLENVQKEKESSLVPKSVTILARLCDAGTPFSATENAVLKQAESVQWILVSCNSGDSDACEGIESLQWVRESVMNDWIGNNGTILSGNVTSGEVASAVHSSVHDAWIAPHVEASKSWQQQHEAVSKALADTTQSFQEYKQRAQTALKRVGNDEKERLAVQAAHAKQLEEANDRINDALEENKLLEASVAALEEELAGFREQEQQQQGQLDSLKNRLAEETGVFSMQLAQLKDQVGALEDEKGSLGAENTKMRIRISELEEKLKYCESANGSSGTKSPVAAASGAQATPTGEDCDSDVQHKVIEKATGLSSLDHIRPPPIAIVPPHVENSVNMEEECDAADTEGDSVDAAPKFILYAQEESAVKNSNHELRVENIKLQQEVTNLRSLQILSEEQLTVLKDAIRQLESELSREKEFNANNRRVNAEYLVNVLKKFLMSTNLSEREKLVTVLCSILHIPAEDSNQINAKWNVKAQQHIVTSYSGGVVVGNGSVLRWLMADGSDV